jgi:hypothetical protein
VDGGLVQLGIPHRLLHRLQRALEAGLEIQKTRFLKNPAQWVFRFFLGFFGFLGDFGFFVYLPRRESF